MPRSPDKDYLNPIGFPKNHPILDRLTAEAQNATMPLSVYIADLLMQRDQAIYGGSPEAANRWYPQGKILLDASDIPGMMAALGAKMPTQSSINQALVFDAETVASNADEMLDGLL